MTEPDYYPATVNLITDHGMGKPDVELQQKLIGIFWICLQSTGFVVK